MAEIQTVRDGKVKVEGFPDGSTVIVMSPGEKEPYVLTAEQEHRIQQSKNELACGEGIDADEFFKNLNG